MSTALSIKSYVQQPAAEQKFDTTTKPVAGGILPSPTKIFTGAAEAIAHMEESYIPALKGEAKRYRDRNGTNPKDQVFPVEVLSMAPPRPKLPPLLVIGGMGPLAGAMAFNDALKKFGDSREIVLVQYTTMPDRTAALDEDEKIGWEKSDAHVEVHQAFTNLFIAADETLTTTGHTGPAHLVVACNTAHNFVPDGHTAYGEARGHRACLTLESLIVHVTNKLSKELAPTRTPLLILGTNGTLKTKLYINPLEKGGVACKVPEPAEQGLLMKAIYDGVKGFDSEATVRYGNALFEGLAASGHIEPGKEFVVLAGCTEVPEIVAELQKNGSPKVKELLASARIADPVLIAYDHIAEADTRATSGQISIPNN